MAIAFVQSATATPAGGTSLAKAFGSNVTAGNALFASATTSANTTVTFSSSGDSWTTLATFYDSTAGQLISIGYAPNVTGGAKTVTATYGVTGSFCGLIISEWSGVATSSPVDVNNTGQALAASSTPTDSPGITTTVNGDLIYTVFILDNSATVSGGGPGTVTQLGFDSNLLGAEGQVQTTHGNIQPSVSLSANPSSAIMSAAFKPAGAAAATYPPLFVRRRQVPPFRATRMREAAPVRPQVNPPFPFVEFHQSRILRGLAPRRAHAVTPVPAQVVVTPPAYPPTSVRTRTKGLRLFRPRASTPTPTQAVVPPPTYVPPAIRGRLKLPAIRRHDIAPPIIDQLVPPQQVQRSRFKVRPARSRTVALPPPQEQAPLFTRVKLHLARAFRGKSAQVVPAQVIVVPPPYPPQPSRARREVFAARRRKAGVDGWMVQGVTHLCVTPRPTTGTTGRPGTGTTAYNTATTSRPTTGITTRPNTGDTPDPC